MLYSQVPENNSNNTLLGIIVLIMFIIAIWINFAAASKRFQDIGLSGWRCLLLLIPIVKIIVYIYLCTVSGQGQATLNANTSSNIPTLNKTFTRKQNNYNIFAITLGVITIIFIGIIFLFVNLGNKMKQTSENTNINEKEQSISDKTISSNNKIKEKTLLDYYNEGYEFCSHFNFDGNNSWYYCTIEYIENNANYEINKQLKSIQQNCEISTTCNADYMNCIHRVIEEIAQ